MKIDRRTLLSMVAGAAVGPVTYSSKAAAADEQLVVVSYGGLAERALKRNFYDPFTAATGIKILPVAVSSPDEIWTRLKAAQEGKFSTGWDLVEGTVSDLILRQSLTQPIDCDTISNAALTGVPRTCTPYGVRCASACFVISNDRNAFPQGGPQNWRDFWDVAKYPGPRGLPSSRPEVVIAAALLSDGVNLSELFPFDFKRAFKRLDQLKGNIVWWRSGDQSYQTFRSAEVVSSLMYNGRPMALIKEGFPVDIVWNESFPSVNYWMIPESTKQKETAIKFLNFFLERPEAHAGYLKDTFYETPNKQAGNFLTPEERANTLLANYHKTIDVIGNEWVALNLEHIKQEWTKWISA